MKTFNLRVKEVSGKWYVIGPRGTIKKGPVTEKEARAYYEQRKEAFMKAK